MGGAEGVVHVAENHGESNGAVSAIRDLTSGKPSLIIIASFIIFVIIMIVFVYSFLFSTHTYNIKLQWVLVVNGRRATTGQSRHGYFTLFHI